MTPPTDKQGGEIIPEDRIAIAKEYDLVTLPRDVQGKNCSNCYFVKDGVCHNRHLRGMQVNERMSCKLWDHVGIYESWSNPRKGITDA